MTYINLKLNLTLGFYHLCEETELFLILFQHHYPVYHVKLQPSWFVQLPARPGFLCTNIGYPHLILLSTLEGMQHPSDIGTGI
jgi:hypothetical protein